ncbi:MAG TPA: hypothetical protein VLV88_01415 [Terriglobales bacterium]|nr:hypothetical protein [Terriglobales bacterium]HUL14625.1 hypothetical protein [Terriglobales bacterium]
MRTASRHPNLLAISIAALILAFTFVTPSFARAHSQNSNPSDSPRADKGDPGQGKQDKKDPPKKSSQHLQTQAQAHPADQTAAGSAATQNASARNATPRPATSALVWVNTDTKVFHKPGTKWYGKTKHGKYMTESDALRAGYRPASKE